jgi:glycosyltransferase involved in cell wall biosynthesis
MKKLRILVVGQTPPPVCGQAVMIQNFLEGEYRNIELIHVRMNFSRELDSAGKFRFAKLNELVRVIANIFRCKFIYRPDVIYYPPSGPRFFPVIRDMAVLGLTRWLFRFVVFHFHAGGLSEYFHKMNPLSRSILRFAFVNPDLVIHTSTSTPRDGLSLGCKHECIIANGIPDAAGDYIIRKTGANTRVHILFVAFLCEDKGILIAIQAALEMLRAGYDIELTCLGKWQSTELQARAIALIDPPFRSRFSFPGVIVGEDKWQYYRSAQIFLFPSYYHSETFGIVLLEAMSFSLPVVATRWRGIPDVVDEGGCALLCEPRDIEGCRNALEQLVENPSLRNEMGRKSRDRFLSHFTIETHRNAMERALSQLKQ